MRISVLLSMLLLVSVFCGGALAGGPDTGFFFGGAGNVLMMDGTGDWDGTDFEIDYDPSSDDESSSSSSTMGFNWDSKMLFGVKPVVGYKVNPQFAVQGAYSYLMKKSTESTEEESTEWYEFEASYTLDWTQHSIELVGIFYPSTDANYYLFGGLDMVTIEADVNEELRYRTYDGYDWSDWDEDSGSESDDLSTTGIIFGVGMETPQGENSALFFSAQYSTATTDDKFFGSDDFKVKVGGFSGCIGMKWYMPAN